MISSSVSNIGRKSSRLPASEHGLFSEHHRVGTSFPVTPILHQARFLQGLTDSERSTIFRTAQPRTYAAYSVIAEQGTVADRFFMLARGSVRYFFITSQGQDVSLFWLAPGDIFGGASLLTLPAEFIVSTETTKESTILVWQRDAIRRLATQFPRLLENGLSIACDYLVWYLATHLSLVFDSARERLAHVIHSLSHGIGQRCTEGVRLEITNEQLANTANLTPFTVSRLLNEWQRNGAILKSRGSILLCRPEQLFGQKPTTPIQKLRV